MVESRFGSLRPARDLEEHLDRQDVGRNQPSAIVAMSCCLGTRIDVHIGVEEMDPATSLWKALIGAAASGRQGERGAAAEALSGDPARL